MRYAVPFVLIGTPAFAHHEAVVVSVMPGVMVWLAALAAAGFSAWRWRQFRRGKDRADTRDES